jgi:Tol biopolymer transport system component
MNWGQTRNVRNKKVSGMLIASGCGPTNLRLLALCVTVVAVGCGQSRGTQLTPTQVVNSPVPATAAATMTVVATTTVTPTPMPSPSPSPLPPALQLTYLSVVSFNGYAKSIYGVSVGCLEKAMPCFGQPQLLLQSDLQISSYAWSPDGARIAFAAYAGDQYNIYVANWDGSNRINVSNSPDSADFPAWSPDGQSIGFESCNHTGCSLVRINPDGSGREILLQQAAGATKPESPRLLNWSPDSKAITFVATSGSGAYDQVFVSDLAGTHISQLTNESTGEHLSPSYSHTGSQISYTSDFEQGLSTRSDVWVMHSDGNNATNLTRGALRLILDTAWSPQDDWLAFSSEAESDVVFDIYIVRPDGTSLINVTNTKARNDFSPAWRVVKQP